MKKPLWILCFVLLAACHTEEDNYPYAPNSGTPPAQEDTLEYLALGDSYTKGESVCGICNYPTKLSQGLFRVSGRNINQRIVAQTGWTTSDLLYAISQSNLHSHYHLVTLLIGVNNQYIGEDFSVYETEFNELLDKAVLFANGNSTRVVVISIPDYAYTSYGASLSEQKRQTISTEIDAYNLYAQQQAAERNITFLNITDITRNGLSQPDLVASDGLHPSALAYQQFVERLLPIVREKLNL